MVKKLLLSSAALALVACASAKSDVAIRLNQVGYFPNEEKVVVIEGINPAGKIQVKNLQGKTVLKPRNIRQAQSPWGDKTRYVVDISDLKKEGDYEVCVAGAKAPLRIGRHALHDISVASLKLFYLIRSGIPIESQYAGSYARPLGHADTQVLVHPSAASESRPEGTVISSPLGWYDAGDYNKYVVNSAFSIGLMLGVYEENKAYFDRLQTNIPESKNQTADFLDEMMFNMLWILTMQDPDDGGVYHKLTTPNFEGFVMPKDCHQPRYVVAKSVTATLDFAAVMAQMARLMKGNADYPDFSAKAAEAAERAYLWALVHPDAFYRQGDMNKQFQPAVNTGEYGDGNATDERFWAATELYKLTGKTVYKQDALRLMPSDFLVPSWGNVSGLGMLSWLSVGDAAQADKVRQALQACCDAYVKDTDQSCFQAPYGNHAHDFGWGHLSERCCGMGIALLFSDQYVAKGKYRRYALENIDCLLGRNALGYCYVTGFGQKSPMHPHHRPSAADGIDAPFPGMLVGGPNPGQQDKGSNLVYPSSLPDESYVDHADSYASNEIAINWNAALVGLLCWVDATE
ncbi:MAG: glycoside hydrolase family 9 protein [Prevotella sp.]|nr:glycoside hydrolase family 9 protein [Prevotella sp.]